MRDPKSVVDARFSHVVLAILAVSVSQVGWVSSQDRKEHVCSDIDIRNNVTNFKRLNNCTVIEGFLQILLIEKSQAQDFENLTFPDLREITDYFLLYRVYGMKTLSKLFPNLTVIRGSKLFHNFAFVVYEMLHLQEIALPKLVSIKRGAVRIEKNPNLCYLNTIDWDLIAPTEGRFIEDNKPADVCPNNCPDHCKGTTTAETTGKRLCWNSISCQKVCHNSCTRSCDDSGNCCHDQCLGGCTGKTFGDCAACKGVDYKGRCLKECPRDITFKYLDRRCLDEKECIALSTNGSQISKPKKFKPFLGICDYECPEKYMEDVQNPHQCVSCTGHCPKECGGMLVDSIAAAQHLKGCTKISGALQIQISGGKNIVHELENNLDKIEEITEYLKVVRSFPLISLNFLRNLRIIHGLKTENQKYAMYVLDNQNLQELWNWENRSNSLQILNGSISFHFNPKLCMREIRELGKRAFNQTIFDDTDVSKLSNGDKVACEVETLNLNIVKLHHRSCVISWDNFKNRLPDKRTLLGYAVSYKEVPYGNVTLYDGRDACGTDPWKVIDVEATSTKIAMHIIPRLKPFTRYAIYVRTYMIASENLGAQSAVVYFTTAPFTPTSPLRLKASSNSSSTLVISWKPPATPNGNITYYHVVFTMEADDQEFLDQRNFCEEPIKIPVRKDDVGEVDATVAPVGGNSTMNLGQCCACTNDSTPLHRQEDKTTDKITFEDFVHNTVYIKYGTVDDDDSESDVVNDDGGRSRRDAALLYTRQANEGFRGNRVRRSSDETVTTTSPRTTSTSNVTMATAASSSSTTTTKPTVNTTESNNTFHKDVRGRLDTVLTDLKHFTEYTIKVKACHETTKNGTPSYNLCSVHSVTTARTMHLIGADNIDREAVVTETNNATRTVKLKWPDPPSPNGLIVNYHIEYKQINIADIKPVLICIPHKRYRDKGGEYQLQLGPGNYSLRLKATSLAGDGDWIEPLYVNIPESSGSLSSGVIAAIAVCVTVIIMIVFGAGWIVIRKKSRRETPDVPMYISINPDYINAVYVLDEWEVAREKISLLKELGQGSFGMVYEGEATDVNGKSLVRCAVKTVNEKATLRERLEFLHEASVMKSFDCHHVVRLLGVVSKGQPTLVIMELMANGDLKSYLRSHRPDSEENPGIQPPTLKRILQMAIEIADGMAYLSEKKYVHRDLAARNCMVAEDLTVKIGDFGMTRDIYETDYYRKGGKGLLPVRWMAPESLKDGVFTSQCDVWSYGVVLWEMATLASQPYQGLSNEQVLKYVIDCGIMEKPENCPDKLYDLMLMCWHYQMKARPTFLQLIELLLPDANSNFANVSFYSNREAHSSSHDGGDIAETTTTTTPLTISEKTGTVSYGHGGHRRHNLARREREAEEGGVDEEEEGEDDEEEEDNGLEVDVRKSPRPYKWLWPFSKDRGPPASSNRSGKPISTSSSDGSKDSKASASSANGSVGNGHLRVHRLIPGGTEC